MSGSNCCLLTCIQISQEVGQVVWYSHLFKNFPQFVVVHIVIEAEVDVFLKFSCFFYDPAKMQVTQSCPTLYNPVDYTVYGILQAWMLEWVMFPFSRGFSQPKDQTQVSHTAGRFFTSLATSEAHVGKLISGSSAFSKSIQLEHLEVLNSCTVEF